MFRHMSGVIDICISRSYMMLSLDVSSYNSLKVGDTLSEVSQTSFSDLHEYVLTVYKGRFKVQRVVNSKTFYSLQDRYSKVRSLN